MFAFSSILVALMRLARVLNFTTLKNLMMRNDTILAKNQPRRSSKNAANTDGSASMNDCINLRKDAVITSLKVIISSISLTLFVYQGFQV